VIGVLKGDTISLVVRAVVVDESVIVRLVKVYTINIIRVSIINNGVVIGIGKVYAMIAVRAVAIPDRDIRRVTNKDAHTRTIQANALHYYFRTVCKNYLSRIIRNGYTRGVFIISNWPSIYGICCIDGMSVPVFNGSPSNMYIIVRAEVFRESVIVRGLKVNAILFVIRAGVVDECIMIGGINKYAVSIVIRAGVVYDYIVLGFVKFDAVILIIRAGVVC
jgi:hypothetical protein